MIRLLYGIAIGLLIWCIILWITSISYVIPTTHVGINASPYLAELESVGVPPVMADLVKHSRPFQEVNPSLRYDVDGWPLLAKGETAKLITALGYTDHLNPSAPVIAIYDAYKDGHVSYQGYGKLNRRLAQWQHDGYTTIIDEVTLDYSHPSRQLRILLQDGHIKRLRIVPIGGVCKDTPYIHVYDGSYCQNNFISFQDTYLRDPHAEMFNPHYLKYYRQFPTIRYMNFYNTSPSATRCKVGKTLDAACVSKKITAQNLPAVTDITYGTTHATAIDQRVGRGLPPTTFVKLVNTLKITPWMVVPHHADDGYIQQMASAFQELDKDIVPYVEYSNEVWNGIYLSYHYLQQRATERRITPLEMYVQQATHVHQLWRTVSHRPIQAVIAGQQWDVRRTEQLLQLYPTIDVLAIGGYYYLCNSKKMSPKCASFMSYPTTASELLHVIQQSDNPYSPYRLMNIWQQHQQVIDRVSPSSRLAIYEGGPHLTIDYTSNHQGQERVIRDALASVELKQLNQQLVTHFNQQHQGPFLFFTGPETQHKHWFSTISLGIIGISSELHL